MSPRAELALDLDPNIALVFGLSRCGGRLTFRGIAYIGSAIDS